MKEGQQIDQNDPQESIGRTAAWPIVLTVCCGFLALELFSTSSALLDPSFLSGFAQMILQIGILSVLGGGFGIAAGELLIRCEACTKSMIRFLRLGRWFLFFVAWATPVWWIRWSKALEIPLWTEPIFQLVIGMLPTMISTACYFYLSGRHTLQLNRRTATLTIIPNVLSDALVLSFLLQILLYANGWRWFAALANEWPGRPIATVFLLIGVLFFYRIGRYNFAKTADMNAVTALLQIREADWMSVLGSVILWLLCFVSWFCLPVLITDLFVISPLKETIATAYTLLTGGSEIAAMRLFWEDVGVSLQELLEGILIAGLVSLTVVKILQIVAVRDIRATWFIALTHTIPIVIAVSSMPLIGIGHWFRASIVAAVSVFPFVQTLWGLSDQPLLNRILLAIDNSLPYAFVGMLFGQLWASTAGVGFFIVMSRAKGNGTEALAASLITFGLLAAVSFILRFAARRFDTRVPATAANCPPSS
jgi:ABC-type nitrate/sulfonate/bicarbonate transport system permease component